MLPRIQTLSPILIDKIAAGEVIEGPFSVIKELGENAIDANAKSISITTQDAGTTNLTIEDDGYGIHPDDLPSSIMRHATSKIGDLSDLETLQSLGFRGEALATIAAVSHLRIKSRIQEEALGAQILCRGAKLLQQEAIKHSQGTSIAVSNLFYSTPARRNYLKSFGAENKRNYKEVVRLALSAPQVEIRYTRDVKSLLIFLPIKTYANVLWLFMGLP